MRRWAFHILAGLSLLLGFLSAFLGLSGEQWGLYVGRGHYEYVLGTGKHGVFLSARWFTETMLVVYDRPHLPLVRTGGWWPPLFLNPKVTSHEALGFALGKVERLSRGGSATAVIRYVVIPHWFSTLLLVTPVFWLIGFRRARRCQKLGLCAVCGYDLRATPERCPECGTVVTKHNGAIHTRSPKPTP